MSVIADTSQVEMLPYVATAEPWSEVHKVTAVSRSDLEANTAFVGASVGVAVVGVSVGDGSGIWGVDACGKRGEGSC